MPSPYTPLHVAVDLIPSEQWKFVLDLAYVLAATYAAIFQQFNVTVGSFLVTEIVRTLLREHAERTGYW